MIERQTRLDKVVAKLREQGCRMTPQRMAVLKVMIGNREHLSVEQIYERVKADFPMTSLATIYKALAVLKEMGEVLEIDLGAAGARYDGGNPHPHPHLICVECGSIIDIDLPGLNRLPQEVARRTGYQIVRHRLDFFGICPQCQENARSPKVS